MQDEASEYAAHLRASFVSVLERCIDIDGAWPDSLTEPNALTEPGDSDPPWAASVRETVAAFLKQAVLREPHRPS